MNAKFIISVTILLLFFIVGCTNQEKEEEQENIEDTSNQSAEKVDSALASPPPVETFKDLNQVKGDIRNVHYAENGHILISAESLYLFDVTAENIIAEVSQEEAETEKIWIVENGYVAIRETLNDSTEMLGGTAQYQVIFYNDELEVVSEFDLQQLIDEEDLFLSLQEISFSKDGTKMSYATHLGLYLYDFATKQKTKVVDLTLEDMEARSYIAAFEQIGFIRDETQIAFKAQTLPTQLDQPSFDTCGIVDIDGSNLFNRTFDEYTCKRLTAYDELLLLAEDPVVASGRLLVMMNETEETTIHTLIEKEESGTISGSDKGAYFATSIINNNDFTIRIYQTEDGQLVGEQQVTADENGLYLSHDPIVKVLDDTKTVIVLLGSKREDIETKMLISHF
ncbi:hypothetical protein [Bacillus sp. JCM 19034]|uniref:hypothetical protein n=1 Tax=Bacillus sp. JCM 19034 TaxID=1481928 RepID=UPI0007862E95|nr:hypothetical protein [Bacillus sp. JCM 19034]